MYRFIIALIAVFCMTTVCSAGSARLVRQYEIDRSLREVVSIMCIHEDKLMEASGCQIVRKDGDKIVVKQRVGRRAVTVVLKNEANIDFGKKEATITTELIEGKHPIRDYEMKIYVRERNGKTILKVSMYSSAAFPSIQIRAHLAATSSKFKRELFELCEK